MTNHQATMEAAKRAMHLWNTAAPHQKERDTFLCMCVLAKAWLAEHRDDDEEPVTTEWLEMVGFSSPGAFGQLKRLPAMGEYRPVELYIEKHADGGWWAKLFQGIDDIDHNFISITSKTYNTRGELRALCRALGVKESP